MPRCSLTAGLAAIAAGALTLSSVGALVPAPSAPGASAPAASGADPKPFSAGEVVIDAEALASGVARVVTDPIAGLAEASVTVVASGKASVLGGDEASPVPSERSTTSARVVVGEAGASSSDAAAAVADATGSTVTATLTGTAADGSTLSSSDTVWVDHFGGETLASELGEQDLRLQRVDTLLRSGAVTAAEAEALDETILGATESTDAVAEAVCPAASVCVSGTALWTDSAGGTHPVDRSPVQIRDQETGADQVVATVTTDGSGFFNATIDNNDGDATGRDVYVRVSADGPTFTLDQHIDSAVSVDVPSGSAVTKNLTANNTADNNTAFSVHAALVYASDFIVAQNGGPLPTVPVIFPSDGSYYDGTAFNLLALDRFDWDVALHEFGHYVADELNIENNPGGPHSGEDNLSDSRGSKAIGVPLAFGEGWPTFFAVSALHDLAAGAGVPNVGDTKYQDTEDLSISDDLEVNATLGEDNELTVMNVFWDLYDAVNDGRDTVSLGSAVIWDKLDDGDPTTLSEAYRLFSPGLRTEGTNCIFTQMNVAPKLKGATSQPIPSTPPTLTWKRGNGGTHANNRFSVKFRDAGGALLFATVARNTTSFTPGAARWASIVGRAGGSVRVTVVGSQTDNPATGPYRSCTQSFGAL